MKTSLLLSLLLLSATSSALAHDSQPTKQKADSSAVAEKGLFKVTVMYPNAEGKTFDMAYYEKTHMPLVASFLGSNLVRYTIEKGVANGAANPVTPYAAVGAFYVKSYEKYQAAVAPQMDVLRADLPRYTNIAPVVFVSEVVK